MDTLEGQLRDAISHTDVAQVRRILAANPQLVHGWCDDPWWRGNLLHRFHQSSASWKKLRTPWQPEIYDTFRALLEAGVDVNGRSLIVMPVYAYMSNDPDITCFKDRCELLYMLINWGAELP